jgi:non-ribosomal peptide synthetase component F
LFEGRDNGTVNELKAFVEACMADYDLEGWTAPDLINSDDINFAAKNPGKSGHGSIHNAVAGDRLEVEQSQPLAEWNETQIDTCVHHLFEAQVERSPDIIAAVFPGTARDLLGKSGRRGEEQLTYRELNQRANQLAHHLQTLGVGPEVLVGLCVERSLEMVIGLLGILKAGGAYLPLDPDYPRERLTMKLTDAQHLVLLSQSHLLDAQLTISLFRWDHRDSKPNHSALTIVWPTHWARLPPHKGS